MTASSNAAPTHRDGAVATPRRIAMPFRGRWLRKVLVRGLGLPRARVYALLRRLKRIRHAQQVQVRERIGKQLAVELPGLEDWHRRGYKLLTPGDLPGLDSALLTCRSIFAEQREAGPDVYAENKEFLLTTLANQGFAAYPDLVRLMVSEPLLRLVSAYLGAVPVLASARLWWSPARPAAPPSASQRYHSDHEDSTQAKLLLYVEDVDPGCGPFTFLPPGVSDRVRDAAGTRKGRIDDEKVAEVALAEEPVVLTGPAGTAAIVDPSRCLHHGSRATGGDRFALMAQFLRYDSPVESSLALQVSGELSREDWTPLQRLVLGIRD